MMDPNLIDTASAKENSQHLPFCHHVFFWLKNPDNAQDRAKFETAIKELLQTPEIIRSHIGVPAAVTPRPVLDSSYTYSLLVIFNDIQAHDAYQVHPNHLKFIDENKHLWDRVQVYDSVSV
jgi:hypothetical protein